MPIITKLINSKSTWEKFVLKQPDANFLQSYNWGRFHEALGKEIFRWGYYQSDELIGVCLTNVEKAKRATYLTVPGGPLINWNNRKLVDAWGQSMKDTAKETGAAFVRVRPQLLENEKNQRLFSDLEFHSAPMHLHAEHTLILDLKLSEEKILKGMRKNTRREVRNYFKAGIEIKVSIDPTDIKDFYEQQLSLAKKHNFIPFSYKYLYEQFKVFAEDKQAILVHAYQGNKLLSTAFVIFYGLEAVYHYGISTPDNYKLPGAYACQWEAIKEAKKRGCQRYNFWGLAPKDNPKHRFYGPSLFKRGFGGEEFKYLHAQDLPITWRYWLNWMFESLRKRFRGL